MAAGIQDVMGASMIGARVQGTLTAEIIPNLAAAEALWRSLEADPACLCTPYQRFDWAAGYLWATGTADDARIAVLRDAGGRPRLLLPLVLRRERGLAVARTVGDAHANYHLPLFAARDTAALPPADVHAALTEAGREAGIDVYVLAHQPRIWEGVVNPLATGEPEASDAYGLFLGPDPEASVRRAFSADARKKLRSKEKRLVEAKGAVAYRRAETPEEAHAYLAAFYRQKAARFAGKGIPDPYASEPIRRFLAAASGLRPAMEVHVLQLVESGRVLAVFGGAVTEGRYSGMFTSFDGDPEISRFSPGDLLLQHLVRDQTARGRRGFDLGIGEARYKASVCDETIEMVETVLPVTVRGRAFGLFRVGLTRTKRRIKRDPRLHAAAKRFLGLYRSLNPAAIPKLVGIAEVQSQAADRRSSGSETSGAAALEPALSCATSTSPAPASSAMA